MFKYRQKDDQDNVKCNVYLKNNKHIQNIIDNDKIVDKLQDILEDLDNGEDDAILEINFKTKHWFDFGCDYHLGSKNHKIKGNKKIFMNIIIKLLNIYKSNQLDELYEITKDPELANLFGNDCKY